jgi:hypothetical protein
MLRTTYSPPAPAEKMLALDCVQSAHFWGSGNPFLWTGVVGVVIGQEFDVRQVSRRRWYASDDDGRRHYGRTVVAAVERAVGANH